MAARKAYSPRLRALDPDQRGLDAVGVVGLAHPRLAAGADLAAVERGVGIAVELDDALVPVLGAGGDRRLHRDEQKLQML